MQVVSNNINNNTFFLRFFFIGAYFPYQSIQLIYNIKAHAFLNTVDRKYILFKSIQKSYTRQLVSKYSPTTKWSISYRLKRQMRTTCSIGMLYLQVLCRIHCQYSTDNIPKTCTHTFQRHIKYHLKIKF